MKRCLASIVALWVVCLVAPVPVAAQNVRVPGFKPSTSGLKFKNSFANVPLLTIDIIGIRVPIGNASNGLCGGMIYTARDYFEAGLLPPTDTASPSSGLLFDYMVRRLFDSFNLPGGPLVYRHLMDPNLPDHETVASNLGLAPRGRAWVMIVEQWPGIKADLDRGVLVPLGLIRVKTLDVFQMGRNHQVLAYGYDLVGNDLAIRIYDPNHELDDSVMISLNIGDPQHTTPVTQSTGEPMFCFFRTGYGFSPPPVLRPCASPAASLRSLRTGYDQQTNRPLASGVADDNWEVIVPGRFLPGPTCATVVPDGQWPIGPWAANSPTSRWIGVQTRDSNGIPGLYVFRITVDLPPTVFAPAFALLGSWTSDNRTVNIHVNGTPTWIDNAGDHTTLQPLPPRAGLGLFRSGPNLVEFLVENAGLEINPVGLRVDGSVGIAPCGPVRPGSLVLNTGFDDHTGQTLPAWAADDNYVLIGPQGSAIGTLCATVVDDAAYPIGPWLASTPRSKWIGSPALESNAPPGIYTFQFSFDVPPGTDASTLALTGGWTSDNSTIDIRINNVSTGMQNDGDFAALTRFPDGAGLGLFGSGRNVVEFRVQNLGTGDNPVGLRVDAMLAPPPVTPRRFFLRADANSDGKVDISDAVNTLDFLFLGGAAPACMDAADSNDDGKIDVSDPTYALRFLFTGGDTPPRPGHNTCGADPTEDGLECDEFTPCRF